MQFCQHKIIHTRLSAYPKIICLNVPNLTVSIVVLWFQAGSRYSPPKKEGLAHLFEHLFICRTRRYPKKQDFLVEMEQKGLVYSAYTGKELVGFNLLSAPGNEQQAIRYLIEAYKTAIITEKDLRQEKLVVRNEEKRNKVNPSLYILRLADQGIWPNLDLSRDIFGSEKSIHNITLEDIKDYRKKLYQPNNMTVIILTPRGLEIERIKHEVGHFSPQEGRAFPKTRFWEVKKQIFEQREIEDTIISFSYRLNGLPYKERVMMGFVAEYLTGGWASVLIQKLRFQLGLTYWVQSEQYSTDDAGYLRFKYTINPEKLEKTIKIIKKEVNKLRSKKITKTVLAIHKKAILTKTLVGINNPYKLLTYYGQFAKQTERKIYLFNEAIQIIQELTGEDILRLANKHFDDKQISVATIGRKS